MKFDDARARAWADEFSFDRLPWTDGGRRAAMLIGTAFESLGYEVVKSKVEGSASARNLRLTLTWSGFAAWLAASLVFKGAGYSGLLCGVAIVSGLVWLTGFPAFLSRFPRLLGKTLRATNVLAFRSNDHDPPVRVVLVTSLDVAPPRPHPFMRRISAQALALVSLGLIVLVLSSKLVFRAQVVSFLILFLLTFTAFLISRIRPFFGEGDTDNKDGIGLLLELGRSWPASRDSRIETRFVAIGGLCLDLAGLRSLRQEMIATWPSKPTLVIALWSPLKGPPFLVSCNGEPAINIAKAAADGLRIPHELADGFVNHDVWPFRTDEPAFVGLIGASAEDHPEGSFRYAADLATEIALRWAKPTQSSAETRARSSQNPG